MSTASELVARRGSDWGSWPEPAAAAAGVAVALAVAAHVHVHLMATWVCPGDRLGTTDKYTAGNGTYERNGYVYASIVGVPQPGDDDSQPVMQVLGIRPAPVVPAPGSVVIAKVTKVTQVATNARIMCCGGQALETDFTGVIRQQDVRSHEVDKVVMYDCFRPGDIVRAKVLSLGDARSYYLTTADNSLGVVNAKSLAGAAMMPISWQEMQCPQTKVVERRKVAKVS